MARVSIPLDRDTGRPRGFAFVDFATAEEAAAAIQQFDGQELAGRPLRVREAEERPPGRAGGPPGGGGGGGGFRPNREPVRADPPSAPPFEGGFEEGGEDGGRRGAGRREKGRGWRNLRGKKRSL